MSWTEERVEKLIRLCDGGQHSASQMAVVLGGITRNAVIGKIHRMGLHIGRQPKKTGMAKPTREAHFRGSKRILTPPKVKEMRRLAQQLRDVEQSTPSARLPIAPPSETGVPGVSLLDLTANGCRFPVNKAAKDEQHLFCNKPRMAGSSYCAHCHAKAYVKPQRSTKRFVMNVRRAAA